MNVNKSMYYIDFFTPVKTYIYIYAKIITNCDNIEV